MDRKTFLATLQRLALGHNSKRTAEVCGLSVRQLQRVAAGESPVPGPLVKLLEMFDRYGVPGMSSPLLSPEQRDREREQLAEHNGRLLQAGQSHRREQLEKTDDVLIEHKAAQEQQRQAAHERNHRNMAAAEKRRKEDKEQWRRSRRQIISDSIDEQAPGEAEASRQEEARRPKRVRKSQQTNDLAQDVFERARARSRSGAWETK